MVQILHHSQESIERMIDVADLDCIYLSYDEPKKEEFWVKIRNMVPWAKRVDGVHGQMPHTKRPLMQAIQNVLYLIDGDNLPQESFFFFQRNNRI